MPVVLTALVGTAGTDVGSDWYRRPDGPRRQPPGPVLGIAWTALYALLAVCSADRVRRSARIDRTAGPALLPTRRGRPSPRR